MTTRALLCHPADTVGIALEPGWWISSGAITGVHEIAPGSTATARFAGLG